MKHGNIQKFIRTILQNKKKISMSNYSLFRKSGIVAKGNIDYGFNFEVTEGRGEDTFGAGYC